MSMRSGRSAWRRGFAGIVLAGLAWSFVAPALPAGQDEMHRCMPPTTAGGAPQVQSGFHEHCGHLSLGACETALACASVPSVALAGLPSGIDAALALSGAVLSRVAAAGDSFRGRPPTPPPNS